MRERRLRRLWPWRRVMVPFDGNLRILIQSRERLAKAVYLDGCSDPEHAALLRLLLRPGMTYYDVGAHVGQFTLMAANRVGQTGRVHAFEVTSEVYQELVANVRLNKLDWVTTKRAAVFDAAGEVELNLCEPSQSSFNSVSQPLRPPEQVRGTVRVRTIALDDYCLDHRVDRIDLMKIDVNGPERQVIIGARRVLSGPDAPVLVCEFNDHNTAPLGYSTADLRRELEQLGYRLFAFDSDSGRFADELRRDRYDQTRNLVAAKGPDALREKIENRL